MKKTIFFILVIATFFVSPAIALFSGIAFALIFGSLFNQQASKLSSLLLKIAVVGLGFGMNVKTAIAASSQGIFFTIISVLLVMITGVLLAKCLGINKKLGYLISSGTAICGGSAIAAVAPVINADGDDTSMSLAVVFTLNAVAMLIFPQIGSALQMSQSEFGMWSAIAIHDTSAVVGAAQMYGEEALQIATTVKLCRALWIIPLSFISLAVFKNREEGVKKVSIPWFILLFVVAMVFNSYFPLDENLAYWVKEGSHKILSLTLFLIGTKLSADAVKKAGFKPVILGVSLWILISLVSFVAIMSL